AGATGGAGAMAGPPGRVPVPRRGAEPRGSGAAANGRLPPRREPGRRVRGLAQAPRRVDVRQVTHGLTREARVRLPGGPDVDDLTSWTRNDTPRPIPKFGSRVEAALPRVPPMVPLGDARKKEATRAASRHGVAFVITLWLEPARETTPAEW